MNDSLTYALGATTALVRYEVVHLGDSGRTRYGVTWWPNGDEDATPNEFVWEMPDDALPVLPDGMALRHLGFGPFDVGNNCVVQAHIQEGRVVVELTSPLGTIFEVPPLESTVPARLPGALL